MKYYLIVLKAQVDNDRMADVTPEALAQRVTDVFADHAGLPSVVLTDPIARRGQVRVVPLDSCLDILPTLIGDILNLHERKR